jgi:hypothetical protein
VVAELRACVSAISLFEGGIQKRLFNQLFYVETNGWNRTYVEVASRKIIYHHVEAV